jgi:hypothetical protein
MVEMQDLSIALRTTVAMLGRSIQCRSMVEMPIQIHAGLSVLRYWMVAMRWQRIARSTMAGDLMVLMVETQNQMSALYNNVGTVPNFTHQVSVAQRHICELGFDQSSLICWRAGR